MQIVAEGQRSTHGVFECEYFAVNHSIPDALAIAVHTGAGTVLHTGDIKLDQLPPDGRPTDLPGMSRLGEQGVDLFLCDSTNAEIPGQSVRERGRTEPAPADPRRGRPRHRGVLRLERRPGSADHRRRRGAGSQGVQVLKR